MFAHTVRPQALHNHEAASLPDAQSTDQSFQETMPMSHPADQLDSVSAAAQPQNLASDDVVMGLGSPSKLNKMKATVSGHFRRPPKSPAVVLGEQMRVLAPVGQASRHTGLGFPEGHADSEETAQLLFRASMSNKPSHMQPLGLSSSVAGGVQVLPSQQQPQALASDPSTHSADRHQPGSGAASSEELIALDKRPAVEVDEQMGMPAPEETYTSAPKIFPVEYAADEQMAQVSFRASMLDKPSHMQSLGSVTSTAEAADQLSSQQLLHAAAAGNSALRKQPGSDLHFSPSTVAASVGAASSQDLGSVMKQPAVVLGKEMQLLAPQDDMHTSANQGFLGGHAASEETAQLLFRASMQGKPSHMQFAGRQSMAAGPDEAAGEQQLHAAASGDSPQIMTTSDDLHPVKTKSAALKPYEEVADLTFSTWEAEQRVIPSRSQSHPHILHADPPVQGWQQPVGRTHTQHTDQSAADAAAASSAGVWGSFRDDSLHGFPLKDIYTGMGGTMQDQHDRRAVEHRADLTDTVWQGTTRAFTGETDKKGDPDKPASSMPLELRPPYQPLSDAPGSVGGMDRGHEAAGLAEGHMQYGPEVPGLSLSRVLTRKLLGSYLPWGVANPSAGRAFATPVATPVPTTPPPTPPPPTPPTSTTPPSTPNAVAASSGGSAGAGSPPTLPPPHPCCTHIHPPCRSCRTLRALCSSCSA